MNLPTPATQGPMRGRALDLRQRRRIDLTKMRERLGQEHVAADVGNHTRQVADHVVRIEKARVFLGHGAISQ